MEDKPQVAQPGRSARTAATGQRLLSAVGARRLLAMLAALGLVGAIAASSAFADAGNPINGTTTGNLVANPNGTVTVFVRGEWNWLSHHSDCNEERAGAGLGVIWNDSTEPGYTLSNGSISAGVGI